MLFPKLETFVKQLNIADVPEDRKLSLQPLIDHVQDQVTQNQEVRLNFICTHNSRRSHLAQVWAQTLAYHFGLKNVHCYSGGTEATALFPMVAQTLEHTGFMIAALSEGSNPVYSIKYAPNAHPVIGFSKTFDAEFNPSSEFAAVLTCSQADEGCPFIAGAAIRIPVTYEDPKVFDNTPQQALKYAERSLQIATEMHYVFSSLKSIAQNHQ